MASRFKTFLEDQICAINEAESSKKYQESDELWLVHYSPPLRGI